MCVRFLVFAARRVCVHLQPARRAPDGGHRAQRSPGGAELPPARGHVLRPRALCAPRRQPRRPQAQEVPQTRLSAVTQPTLLTAHTHTHTLALSLTLALTLTPALSALVQHVTRANFPTVRDPG